MRDTEYIDRQIHAFLEVIDFAYKHKYYHVVICETTDLLNSICKELVLCIGQVPSESLGDNIKKMRVLHFDEVLVSLIERYHHYQYQSLCYTHLDMLSFLCTVSCMLLELRRCLLAHNQHLAEELTTLGIEVCKYMETL